MNKGRQGKDGRYPTTRKEKEKEMDGRNVSPTARRGGEGSGERGTGHAMLTRWRWKAARVVTGPRARAASLPPSLPTTYSCFRPVPSWRE
jgi:hypothetical protein